MYVHCLSMPMDFLKKLETEAASGGSGDIRCFKCKSNDFDARTTQYDLIRICKKCGHQWSSGFASTHPPIPIAISGMPILDVEEDAVAADAMDEQSCAPGFRSGGMSNNEDY